MFEIKCELNVVREEKLGNSVYHNICYRYDIDGNKVVFTQMLELGSIVCVEIRLNKEKLNNTKMYVNVKEDADIYYPQNIEIRFTKTFDFNDTYKYIEELKYAKEIAQAIMDIFAEGSKHWELYQKMKG